MSTISTDNDDNLDATALTKMGEDPATARALESMQIRIYDRLNLIIDQLAASILAGSRGNQPVIQLSASPLDMAALASNARQRQWEAKECRKLAEDMVIATLKNLDNPDWDFADPETSRDDGQGILQLLMQWEPD